MYMRSDSVNLEKSQISLQLIFPYKFQNKTMVPIQQQVEF